MNANSHDLHHLAAAYALDALDVDERRAFEAHYPTCDICNSEVRDFRTVGAILAEGVESAPRPGLKSDVMAEIGRTRQVSPLPPTTDELAERRRVAGLPLAAAAAAVLVVVVGLVALLLRDDALSPTERVLAAPDAVVTTLEGETGSLRIVWSDELDQVAIFGSDLADPGDGMAYALWFVEADGVTPATLFDIDGDDDMVRFADDVADIDPTAWGVTIEPDTGSPQPTGEILYLGEL